MKNLFLLLTLQIIFVTLAYSQTSFQDLYKTKAIGDNYIVYPSTMTQTEVFITVHPDDDNIMFASANTIKFTPSLFISEGVYVTTNGGDSWFGSDTCNGGNINFHGGDPGITIDKNGTFILTRKGIDPFIGLYSHYSTDNGLSWSGSKTISNEDLERASVATDGISSSSNYGRTYAVWVKWAPPYPIWFTHTDDGAQNWASPMQLNSPPNRCAGGDIAIGPNGEVYVTWAGVINSSPFTEIHAGFASSNNGGSSWSINETAIDMNGIQGTLPSKQNIRVNGLPRIAVDNSGGERNGNIYIVTTQKNLSPAGNDPDIIFNSSTDGGATWSNRIRVNQDALNNGKIQYFPAIHVDDNGIINILFYDDRFTTSDSTGVMLARSSDGGNSWKEFVVSDHNFKPIPIGGGGQGYQGDDIDITSANNKIWPVWMDNSSGIYQLWTSPIDYTLLDINDKENIILPSNFDLKQNYPNPFNPVTTIEYSIKTSSDVILTVYDVNGRKVKTLLNEFQSAGNYRIPFDGTNLSSGVYFYRITAASNSNNFTDTRAMILIK